MDNDIFIILHSIFKKMRKLADKELFDYGFTNTEMRLLNMIYFYNANGCSQDEFASKIELDRSNIGRSLKKLENLGYIVREKNKDDQRAFQVFLTEKGWNLKDKLPGIRENIKKTLFMNITEEDFNKLTELLKIAELNLNEKNLEMIKNNIKS